MASIGSYYVRVLPDMSGFTNGLVTGVSAGAVTAGNRAGSTAGQSFSNSMLDFIGRVAIGTTIGRMVTNGFNAVINGFGTGIERLDIVQNYPRVMQNLGIATEDSERSVQRLQDALLGLPTSLQDGVMATQRLTATFGDVDRGTETFIAFNNALVAGMAPAALQSSALEQFAQAVSKGKPDMIEWRSMLNAMPAQLSQVASAMGITLDELGDGLRKGDISMDEFLETIVQLNEEGVDGFASFADQAHTATNTIGTALTNMNNRIGAGWANVLGVIGQENIANAINATSTRILAGFNIVAGAMQWLKERIEASGIGEAIDSIRSHIEEFFANLGASAMPVIQEFASAAVDFLAAAFERVAAVIPIVIDVVSTLGSVFGAAISGVIDFAAGIADAILGIDTTIFTDIFSAVSEAVTGIDFTPVTNFFEGIATAIGNIDFTPVLDFFSSIGEYVSGLFANVDTSMVTDMLERITTYLGLLDPYLETAAGLWGVFTAALGDLVSRVAPLVLAFFTQVGGALGGAITNFITTVAPMAVYAFTQIGSLIARVIPFVVGLGNAFLALAGGAVVLVRDILVTVISALTNLLTEIIGFVGAVLSTVVSVGLDIVGTVALTIESIINWVAGLPGAIMSYINRIVTGALEAWTSIKNDASTAWNNLKTLVTNAVGAVKLNVTNVFNQLRNTVSTTWQNIKSAITTPINNAKEAVRSAIDKIKGFFSFKITWPKIPLPHFSVSGSANPLDWITGGLPKFSVSWYATGGMVDTPTVWLAGAGEKGPELIWPSYEPYMGKYAAAIAEHMDSAGTVNNYYIDGNLVSSDAVLASALETVARRVNGRMRMGTVA